MLRKYYFQDLCQQLPSELINHALEKTAHNQRDIVGPHERLEETDDFINRQNRAQTIVEWFETINAYEV